MPILISQVLVYDLLLSELVEHVECADSALDLAEAIKRYHDGLNLPPSVSLFLPLFEFEPRSISPCVRNSSRVALADAVHACGSLPKSR